MVKILRALIIGILVLPANGIASSFQYVNTILPGIPRGDFGSYGDNIIFIRDAFPDNIVVIDLAGNEAVNFVTNGAFTAGVVFNSSRSKILYSGDNSYSGQIYEIDPLTGLNSGSVAQAGYVQPYLAYDGSSILASGAASGANGVLTVPIKKIDALTYNDLGTISVTVNTGTSASGVGRSIIASDNSFLYVSFGMGGFQDVYEFDSNLNLVQTIKITQITTGQAIGGLVFLNNDLYVFNSSTNELYHYSRSQSTGSNSGGGEGGGCSIAESKRSFDSFAAINILLLVLVILMTRIRRHLRKKN